MSAPGATDLFDDRLEGSVERIVYEHPEGRWAVVRLQLDDGSVATAVGNLAPVHEGEVLSLEGAWVDDRRFGRQFRVSRALAARPVSTGAIQRYLASGLIPGIGPELASRLVEAFGATTLDVLDREPERLLEVRGIGPVRLARIREAWRRQAAERSTRLFLQEIGLGAAMSDRILDAWGRDAEDRVRGDPYCLAASDEIPGIGFRRADLIARHLPGWAPEAAARCRAAVLHVLVEQSGQGHCFVPHAALVRQATGLLRLEDDEPVRRAVARLIETGEVVAEPLGEDEARPLGIVAEPEEGLPRAIWLAAHRGAEERVARRLARIYTTPAADGLPGSLGGERLRRATAWAAEQLGMSLGPEQVEALAAALSSKVLLVTGGPGTGKTTLVDAVVRCAAAVDARIALTAPTGRAAKRLAEATGHDASTIHRFLEYRPPLGFTRDAHRPVEVDLVVVDEASMVDLFLMDALLAALPPAAALLLVGDADQLPPVGPGAVLRDLLASGRLPTVRLREIYRQARRSLIVRNAHRINAGQLPEGLQRDPAWPGGGERDFYFVEEEDGARARELVVELAVRRIPDRFGLDPRREVQVVAPMHRGQAGVSRLNQVLQRALGTRAEGPRAADTVLGPGDRVIQLRNDYDREVFNGDIGFVRRVSGEGRERRLAVEFDGRVVDYDAEAARDVTLAYAISVHKSQGSEYPAVVVVLLPEHHVMLQRNLLYTALTRARRLAVLVGSRRAVARAVRNAAPMQRFTRLATRIGQALDRPPA